MFGSARRTEISDLKAKVHKLENHIAELEGMNRQMRGSALEAEALRVELARSQRMVGDLENEISEKDARIETLEDEVDEARTERDHWKTISLRAQQTAEFHCQRARAAERKAASDQSDREGVDHLYFCLGKWYFWDINWDKAHGPYLTIEEAQKEWEDYCRSVFDITTTEKDDVP